MWRIELWSNVSKMFARVPCTLHHVDRTWPFSNVYCQVFVTFTRNITDRELNFTLSLVPALFLLTSVLVLAALFNHYLIDLNMCRYTSYFFLIIIDKFSHITPKKDSLICCQLHQARKNCSASSHHANFAITNSTN